MLAIDVKGLKKTYPSVNGSPPVHALNGIDLQVGSGEIVAFLGSNGAGKTTAIEIMEGFRTRDSGQVMVLGHDPATASRKWREDIGIVLQQSEPDALLSARESIQLYRSYYQKPRGVEEVLELVGLVEHADKRTSKLSGGQKRRLDLATALIGDPKLVFLDEPTTGFDPSARRDAWGMVENLRQLGATVLLTTHYMDEAEQLCDRIVVVEKGEIIANGTAEELSQQVALEPSISWLDHEAPHKELSETFRAQTRMITSSSSHDLGGQRCEVKTESVAQLVGELAHIAQRHGHDLGSLNVHRPNLEETFLKLTSSNDAETKN